MTRTLSPFARLGTEPRRYRFDAAVRVLMLEARSTDPTEVARFRSPNSVAFAPADVTEIAAMPGRPPQVTTAVMGLTGPTGVLPRMYGETVSATLRNKSRALYDFIDLMAHRMVGHFAAAGIKYRLARAAETGALRNSPDPDPLSGVLLALTGFGTGHLTPRLAAGVLPMLHYSGIFAMRTRSAERLAALVSDWLGAPVDVVQFAGAWLTLPPDQQTRMPAGRRDGAFNRLGMDSAIGVRAWDMQARIVLRLGPLNRRAFEQLLPDRTALRQLVSLVRAYLGFETGFAINPVLAASEIPALTMRAEADPPPRLGWNTWLPVEGVRKTDAPEALFEAEVVESAEPAASGPSAQSLFR